MTSRNPTSRPRKIAGRSRRPAPPVVEPVETPAAEAPAEPPEPELPAAFIEHEAPEPETEDEDEAPAHSLWGGTRATIALVVAVVVLLGVALTEAAYLWGPLEDEPVISTDRPVVTSEVTHRSAVEAAAAAAVKLTARSYETYDEQVDEATRTMTDAFAEEYRQTTDQIKEQFVAEETEVTVEVVAQSVRTGSDEQVEALLFLNQFTTKKGEDPAYAPYRVLVTMVDTEQGWLVSDVETT